MLCVWAVVAQRASGSQDDGGAFRSEDDGAVSDIPSPHIPRHPKYLLGLRSPGISCLLNRTALNY